MNTYKDIQYRLSKSDRKTASIYIERNGEVSLQVPSGFDGLQVEALLESKRRWIYRNLAEWQDLNATRVCREFVSGEGFLYLGRSYRLQIVESQDVPLKLHNGYFHLRPDENIANTQIFKDFYREKGMERIPERVEHHQELMGVSASSIRVQELQNRWGSCTSDGKLLFHWKCMMAPLSVLDYIVVHELAHIKHSNHTQEFWHEVDKAMPDFKQRKDWLRVNGAGMNL